MRTFSKTVRSPKIFVTWYERAMPRRETACARPVMSSPLNRMCPLDGGRNPGEEVEERRLARAVGTDDRAQLALVHLEVDAPERLGEAAALEQTRAAVVPARRGTQRPCGL
jgi:hypothetical protein